QSDRHGGRPRSHRRRRRRRRSGAYRVAARAFRRKGTRPQAGATLACDRTRTRGDARAGRSAGSQETRLKLIGDLLLRLLLEPERPQRDAKIARSGGRKLLLSTPRREQAKIVSPASRRQLNGLVPAQSMVHRRDLGRARKQAAGT